MQKRYVYNLFVNRGDGGGASSRLLWNLYSDKSLMKMLILIGYKLLLMASAVFTNTLKYLPIQKCKSFIIWVGPVYNNVIIVLFRVEVLDGKHQCLEPEIKTGNEHNISAWNRKQKPEVNDPILFRQDTILCDKLTVNNPRHKKILISGY